MATSPAPIYQPYYQPYYNPGNQVGFDSNTNPVKATQNQRAVTQSTGDRLMGQDEQLANQYAEQQSGTQQYLNPIQQGMAAGQGGYSPTEASQILLSPEQKEAIKTNAGISAGVGNAAAVGGAERAAAAAGGNPAALAIYRARAAQAGAANAGQAETGAEVAGQQAGSAGAQAVGQARQGQQNQALGYFGNLQAQQGSQAQNEQGLTQGAFGTQTSGTSAATGQQVEAAKQPTTTDKVIGGLSGFFSALEDGRSGVSRYLADGGQDAVVGENGTEAIIEDAPKAVVAGASDPVRSNTRFMDEGQAPLTGNNPPATSGGATPWWQQATAHLTNYLKAKPAAPASPTPGDSGWNKTMPWNQAGSAVGHLLAPSVPKPAAPATLPNGQTYNVPEPPIASTDDPGAPAMMADGDSGGSILDNYLKSSQQDELAPAAAPQPSRQPQQGQQQGNTGSQVGSAVGNVAKLAALAFLDDGRAPEMMAGGHMGSGFHWSERTPRAPHVPPGGFQPLAYHPKPMLADGVGKYLADGSIAEPQGAPADVAAVNNPMAAQGATPMQSRQNMRPGNGMQVGNAKVFTKPTLVHLEREDMVVPLSYRPKAKVRPSAALPAMMAGASRG